jgi:predicted nuclease with TOPRIM domain
MEAGKNQEKLLEEKFARMEQTHARISAVQTQNKHLEQKFSRLNDKIRMLDELDSLIAEFEDCYDTYHEMRDEVAILSEQADELFQVAPFNFSHKKRQELPKS